MIEVRNVVKKFGEQVALNGVSFTVPKGEVVGLLGTNGAGKTTTMRILSTLVAPTAGSALVGGHDVVKEPGKVRTVIGYLPETPPIYPELRVRQFVTFVAEIKGCVGARKRSLVDDALNECQLTAVADRICGTLSKGYKQRIGIAQAIVHRPEVIILDEPTSGLDPAQILETRKLIRSLAGKHTVLVSSHILNEVVETCSRVIMIADGTVKLEGLVSDLNQGKGLEQRFLDTVIGVSAA